MSTCKSTQWRKDNPEKWKAQSLAYRERRAERRKIKYDERSDEQKIKDREVRSSNRLKDPKRKEKSNEYRRLNVLRRCGMSLEEARAWYAETPKACAICGAEEEVLCVDHDHTTMTVRGFLCHFCNVGLGHFKDSPHLLDKAKEYLCERMETI